MKPITSLLLAAMLALFGVPALAQTSTKGIVYVNQALSPCPPATSCSYSDSSATVTNICAGADGASAVALRVNTTTAWSNATAKLASFATNNVERVALYTNLFGVYPALMSNGPIMGFFNSNVAPDGVAVGNTFVNMFAQGVQRATFTALALIMGSGVNITPDTDVNATIGDDTHRWSAMFTRHLVGGQAAIPTCVRGAGAGTGSSCTISAGSTDLAGTVNVTTAGADEATNATVVTVSFNTAYGSAPRCILSPADADARDASGSTKAVAVFQSNTLTTQFVITSGSAALSNAVEYVWDYHCVQ